MAVQIAVFIGGALGALLRVGVSNVITWNGFPLATLLINLAGTSFLPWWNAWSHQKKMPRWLVEGVGIGGCGGFTTLSSMMLDVERLVSAGKVTEAIIYFLLTVILGALLTYMVASVVVDEESMEVKQ